MDAVLGLDIQALLAAAAVFLIIWAYMSCGVPANFPPGPPRLPFIGNLLLLSKDPFHVQKVFAEMKDRYGNVVGLKLGTHRTVILNDLGSIKQALLTKAGIFAGKPENMHASAKALSKGGKRRGIIMTNGKVWKDSRKLALMSMRDFGLGKKTIEERIIEEAGFTCEEIAKTGDKKPIDNISTTLQLATSNVIASICFGKRFEYNDREFKTALKDMEYIMETNLLSSPVNFFPILRFLPMGRWFTKLLLCLNDLDEFVDRKIEQHRATFDSSNLKDLVDIYLEKEAKGENNEDSFHKDNIRRIILDLFVAGSETSGTSLRWLILYLLHYPHVQKRCQEETDLVVGSGRPPCLADQRSMPYVEATLHEMYRHASVGHVTLRFAGETTTLQGYTIPKNTVVFINLYAVHMDERYWPQPDKFRPERWLTPDGAFQNHDAFVPFSLGPRVCIGENLARQEIFLFFTCLLQRFTFSVDHSHGIPPLESKTGITNAPPHFLFIAKQR